VLTRIADARFKQIVRPGDTLTAEVVLDEELDGAYFLTGRLSANERPVLRVTFACMLAPRQEPSR
jgi:3-hydroxyacyl-[acyl-carrier-protein] dehydratase